MGTIPMLDERIISLLTELLEEVKKLRDLSESAASSGKPTEVHVVKLGKKIARKLSKISAPVRPAGNHWITSLKAQDILGIDRTTLWRHRRDKKLKKWKKQGGQTYYWEPELTELRPRYLK